MLSQFGLERDRSKKKYREFVCRGLKDMKETPFKELYGQVILGREEFMEKAKGLLKGKEMGQEIVERRKWQFIWLGDTQASLTRKLVKLFGGVHYSAVSKSSARLEREIAEDSNLRNCPKDLVPEFNKQALKPSF